ncbi:MAG: hypothetical protein RLZZ273_1351 [Bacteroidota bacterium]|jgi:ribonuclease HII
MTLDYEQPLWDSFVTPIGVDEAGRGALAGPVVAAAVVLNPACVPDGINDSKKLSEHRRNELREQIVATSLAWSVGIVDANRIDEINILQSTFEAMQQAISLCTAQLASASSFHLLIDGNRFPKHTLPVTTVICGDALSPSIAAASIIAKTTRDHIMKDVVHRKFPEYGFEVHKGYGTATHRLAIQSLGACKEHRMSFLSRILSEGSQRALGL